MRRTEYLTGICFILFSSLGLSVTGLLGKIGFRSFTVSGMIFWRFFIAFLICLSLLSLFRKRDRKVSLGNFYIHILRAVLVLISQYSFYFFLERSNLMNAVALLNTGPLFIPLIERGFLGRRLRASTWISLVISFVGVLFVLQPGNDLFTWIGLLGLFAGFCQGASQVIFGINSKKEASDVSVFILMTLTSAISFVFYVFSSEETFVPGAQLSWDVVLIVMGLGIASVMNQIFRAEAYKRGSPSKLAVFLYMSIVFASCFDWLFFHTIPPMLSFLGAALIILGGTVKLYGHWHSER